MRKSIPVVCISVILSLGPLYAAFARPGNEAIEIAVSWAQALVGRTSFPYAGGIGDCPSPNACALFVSNAYGSAAVTLDAYVLWCSLEQHPGDWNAPRGSLVFFDRTPENGYLGHVALCTGDGNLVQGGYTKIKTGKIRWENAARYLGWAWPPLNWPGRSVALKAVK